MCGEMRRMDNKWTGTASQAAKVSPSPHPTGRDFAGMIFSRLEPLNQNALVPGRSDVERLSVVGKNSTLDRANLSASEDGRTSNVWFMGRSVFEIAIGTINCLTSIAQASSPASSPGVPPGLCLGGGTPPQLAAGTATLHDSYAVSIVVSSPPAHLRFRIKPCHRRRSFVQCVVLGLAG